MRSNENVAVVRAPKVLLVGPSFTGGGAEGRFARLAGVLFDGTCDVAVLSKLFPAPVTSLQRVFDLGWRGWLSYPKMALRIAILNRRYKYDVIMAFGMFPNLLAVLGARLSGSPVRVIVHEISRPLKLAEHAGIKRRLLYVGLQKVILPAADAITANSIDGLVETLAICRGFRGLTCRLSNAMDPDVIRNSAQLEPPVPTPKGPFIVCVARLDRMKRLDTVIDAYSLVRDQIKHSLVIVGDGESLPELKTQVERLCLVERVLFTGAVRNPLSIVASASAFVIASDYEGFSNALLEAMFLDVPVVTSYSSSDAREICRQGAALGFEVGCAKKLAAQILVVLTDYEVSSNLVDKGRIYCQTHAIEKAVPQYEEFIRRVVERRIDSLD